MRILHVIYDDIGNPWLGGGGATRTLEIYSRIASEGHTVTVLCGRYPGAPRVETRQGITYRRTGLSASYVLSRLSFMIGAARLIKAGGYDIVIEDVSPYSPVGAPLWSTKGVPAIASVQNLSGRHATHKYGLTGWGPRLVEKPLLSLFSNFIAVSPGIASELRRTLGERVNFCVIPNSVAAGFLMRQPQTPTEHIEGPYILSLGRIDIYQKGLDRLIAAFDMAAAEEPNLKLVIAGGGTAEQMRQLREFASGAKHADRIEMLGQVESERAAQLMAGAVCLVMPSRYEAWPLSAIEAGAVGVPVVGSDIVGVRDAAPSYPSGHGILLPEGNLAALRDTILRVARDADLRAQVGAAGCDWAKQFTWDALADKQLAFYEEILSRRQKAEGRRQ